MATETQKTDDFDAAFAEYAAPEKSGAAAAAETDQGAAAAASGGTGDAGGEQAAAGGSGAVVDDSGGDAGAAAVADDGAAKAAEGGEAVADAGAAKTDEEKAAEEAAADGSGAATAAEAKPAADAGPSADDILAGLKKLVGDVKPAAEAKPAEAAAAVEEKPIYSNEETEFLAQYDKEWGDVVKGEALKRRAEYKDLLNYVFQQVSEFVKPIHETAEALAERTFRTELTSSVPDYSDQLREQVIGWVAKQPAYLQQPYNQVITQGTVDEVKDLIDRFRASTGQPKVAAGAATAGQKKDEGNELSEQAKKAAAAMAPVDSKRSGVPVPGDPSNFDDAWKQAAAELG